MNRDDSTRRLDQLLQGLPVLLPEPAQSNRVRARCRTALIHRHRSAARARSRARSVRRALEPALVAGFCLAYLAGVVLDVLRVFS